MSSNSFPKSEYRSRGQRVHDEMARRGYDVAVVWAKGSGAYERYGNVLWLTNYYSAHSAQEPDNNFWTARSFAAVVLQRGKVPALHNDEPLEYKNWIATDRVKWHLDPIEGVAADLKRRRVRGRVAIVGSDFFPFKYMNALKRLTPGIRWVVEDDLVQSVSVVKSRRERDAFREAGQVSTKAMNAAMKALVSGKSEAEAAARGAAIVIRGGGIPYLIRMAHGTKKRMLDFSRNNLTGCDDTPPQKGDMVRCWIMGPMKHGYYLDPGRTGVYGRASRDQKDLIRACAGIVEGVMEAIRPGVKAHTLARVGDRLYKEAGGGKARDQAAEQWPLYGHGNDMFFCNPMYGLKTAGKDEQLFENQVASSEAFLYWKGVGAAGFEQNFIVTKDGPELLTKTPMIWF
ncbi:MAG: M24 family metallopeptidase [Alphaproteobacteria bacterium]